MELQQGKAMELYNARHIVGKYEQYNDGDEIAGTQWLFRGEGTPAKNRHGQRMAKVECRVCQTKQDRGGIYDFEWYRIQQGRTRACPTCVKGGRASTNRVRDFLKACDEFVPQHDLAAYVKDLNGSWSVLDDLTMERAIFFVAYESFLYDYRERKRLALEATRIITNDTLNGCPVMGGGKYHVKTYLMSGTQAKPPKPEELLRATLKDIGFDDDVIEERVRLNNKAGQVAKVAKWVKIEEDNDQWLKQWQAPFTLGDIARATGKILNDMGFEDHGLDWIDS